MGQHILKTMCPMNCHPTLCGMRVTVNDGRLLSITGDKANPDSQGFLCPRGRAAKEIIANPKRLLHPLIRNGRGEERWREVSWEEALALVTEHMLDAGPEAVGLWSGHGSTSTNYGTFITGQLLRRFAYLHGCQWWNPMMICWGFGAFGLGLTGVLQTNTKEDMGQHAAFILLWAADLTSQPNTNRHLIAARRRGAHITAIDIRDTATTKKCHEVLRIRPGTDTALALAMMHVIIEHKLYDHDFIARRTVGFAALAAQVKNTTPDWAAAITGIDAQSIQQLARRYATTRPAMIVLGGSSVFKGTDGWMAARAVSCLPGLTGQLGIPGGGLGPRHGSTTHGQGLANIVPECSRPVERFIPNQMSAITQALLERQLRVMFLFGSNMLSSFADSNQLGTGLARTDLIVCHDIFMNDTARRYADVVLPGTAWLEQLGCKMTNTHLYLMDQALPPPGQTRTMSWILRALADRLGLKDFFPWSSEEGLIDAIIAVPSTDYATVAKLRAADGIQALDVSHVAYPDHAYQTPSGKLEFYSSRAKSLGLSALPSYDSARQNQFPLIFRQGRALSNFHSFYDHGRALPSLVKLDGKARLWISPLDARERQIDNGTAIRIHNDNGEFIATAEVTDALSSGTVWMHSGWVGINRLTSGHPSLPHAAVDDFWFSAGQASFDARVEVSRLR